MDIFKHIGQFVGSILAIVLFSMAMYGCGYVASKIVDAKPIEMGLLFTLGAILLMQIISGNPKQ